MLHKLIKTWLFDEQARKTINMVSSEIRLNSEKPSKSVLQLKKQGVDANSNEYYSTLSNLYARTVTTTPNAIQKWLKFELIWTTNETDFLEYPMTLSDKSGNIFKRNSGNILPRKGDIVFQGDYETTISDLTDDTVTLTDASNIENGLVLISRSKCRVNVRVHDGTNAYFYNVVASEWQVAGPSDWNTQFQINNHIDTFDISNIGKTIGFDINLKTDDKFYYPAVSEVKLLGLFEIDFVEDMIFDSVIRAFEDNLNINTTIGIILESDTDSIDLNGEYKLDNTGYNFIGDDCIVYNLTTDPHRFVNIFDSYTPGQPRDGGGFEAGVITLTAQQSQNDELEIKIRHNPELAVNTSLDFYEVNRVPSIVFERIEKQETIVKSGTIIGRDIIKDKLNITGVRIEPPVQFDLIFDYAVFTGNQTDQHRLGEALHRLFNSLKFITSWGLDEPYPVNSRDVFRSTNTPNASSINTHVGRFVVKNVLTYIKEPLIVPLSKYLTTDTSTN